MPAHAEPVATVPHPFAYAILVGSNVGGAGQEPLRYAEDDARNVGSVLRELGRYGASDLRVLVRPDAAHVLSTIDDIGAKLRVHQERGEQAVVVFYYSGHARASAISLGTEELPLATLRERLRALPSALTIVILDACQSGSFARIKGAEPAAEFSFNSVSRLTTKGIAVMASSTAQELSQESDELKSSYFTHHLVVALRGAGDADGDGRVSLDEAYRYAYRRTLASTTRTKVGGQHVTLETDLVGQGEVAVTYPAEARSQLELPGGLDARVLVQHKASGSIVAEIQKAPGAPVRLAFAAGSYIAVVRQRTGIVSCAFSLTDDRVTPLEVSGCTPVAPDSVKSKGASDDLDAIREIDRWRLELGAGFIWRTTDTYTDRLNDFGYVQKKPGFLSPSLPTGRFSVGVSRSLAKHISGVFQLNTLAGDTYQRTLGGATDTASFDAYGGAIYVRASTDIAGPLFGVYAQAGGGLSIGVAKLQTSVTEGPTHSTDVHYGYVVAGAAGITCTMPRNFGFFTQVGYDKAPAIKNLIGDTHDSGGPSLVFGFRLRLGEDK
ncbi:MAG: caspase family protein [Polyangiaceae bacterium]